MEPKLNQKKSVCFLNPKLNQKKSVWFFGYQTKPKQILFDNRQHKLNQIPFVLVYTQNKETLLETGGRTDDDNILLPNTKLPNQPIPHPNTLTDTTKVNLNLPPALPAN